MKHFQKVILKERTTANHNTGKKMIDRTESILYYDNYFYFETFPKIYRKGEQQPITIQEKND